MKKKKDVVELVVAIIEDTYECLYVDGQAHRGDMTVYVSDLVEAAQGRLIRLEHRRVDWDGEWPETLDEFDKLTLVG